MNHDVWMSLLVFQGPVLCCKSRQKSSPYELHRLAVTFPEIGITKEWSIDNQLECVMALSMEKGFENVQSIVHSAHNIRSTPYALEK
jgi:hypothetical protein